MSGHVCGWVVGVPGKGTHEGTCVLSCTDRVAPRSAGGVKKQSHYCVSIDVREKKELVMEMHTLLQRISSYWRKNGYIGWDNGTHLYRLG